MSGLTHGSRIQHHLPDRTTMLWLALLVGVELLLVGTYVAVRDVRITDPLILVYPFIWIDVSLLAIRTTDSNPESTRQRLIGLSIAAGYFLVLGYFGGLYGLGNGMVPLRIDWGLPPGYSPAVLYDGSLLRVVLAPYKIIGYLTLAYLVYTTVIDAARAAISGAVGLFSCISCSWPILGTVATSLFGSGSAVATFALRQSYGLGTLVFLSAVALLYYRPRL